MKSREYELTLLTAGAFALALFASSVVQAQVTLPWIEDWESTSGQTYTTSTVSLTGAPEWEYHTGLIESVGKVDNSVGGGTNYTNFPDGLRFNVTNTVVINAVYVYPLNAGDVVVNLLDSNDVVLDSVTVAVAGGATKTRIDVGFIVTPGTGYQLDAVGTTTGGLFRNTGGGVYPYTHPDLSITGAINNIATYYYFFYDWELIAENDGRLRMSTYDHTGTYAATVDCVPNTNGYDHNRLIATLDMTNYAAANDLVMLDFWLNSHNEDDNNQEYAYVRGTRGDPWVQISDLITAAPTDGVYAFVTVDVSAVLVANSQDFGPEFQIMFTQYDDFDAYSITLLDGFSYDDIELYLPQVCGNNTVEGNEACDDGNTVSCDGCSSDCMVSETGCGDTITCGNEACDDGNTTDCDGCSANCLVAETGCGDTILCGNEVCDDGNTTNCDGCRADCSAVESGCGDTFLCGAEVCDDGNTTDCDGCRADCSGTETGCGDTYVCGNEVCDDGNTVDCDGCRADCSATETGCGDTYVCGNEACDDGNTTDCDGCSASCVTETGCGDGVSCGNEVCDDGNTVDCDGCSADCSVAETGCGDGAMCGTESCDDGNTVDCDGCSADCGTVETGCGDGVTCGTEQCDDGNVIDGDGCSASCMSEGTGGAGGTTSSGTGGTTSTSGTGGTSTSSGSDGDTTTDDGGCGCRVVGQSRGNNLAALGLLGLLGLALTRRRRAA